MQVDDQLARLQHVRQPPVPVLVRRLLDEGRQYEGLLYGWADLPDRTGGLRGLIAYRREYTPGYWADAVALGTDWGSQAGRGQLRGCTAFPSSPPRRGSLPGNRLDATQTSPRASLRRMTLERPGPKGWAAAAVVVIILLVSFLVSLDDPTGGWGENNRAWNDDEFWMDFLVQSVGWLLVLAGLGLTAFTFYRQQSNAIADRKLMDEQRAADQRRTAAIEARRRFFFALQGSLQPVESLMFGIYECFRVKYAKQTGSAYPSPVTEPDRAYSNSIGRLAGTMAAIETSAKPLAPDSSFIDGPYAAAQTRIMEWCTYIDNAWRAFPLSPAQMADVGSSLDDITATLARLRAVASSYLTDGQVRDL